jgi:hypothetical protein
MLLRRRYRMLRCPRCEHGFTEVKFSGWTVFTEGTAVIDGTGRVSTVGPMVAKCSIKPGHEIEGKHVRISCPVCSHSGHVSSFPRVLQCFLSGGVGDVVITSPIVGNVAVARDMQRVAEEVLQATSLDWKREEDINRIFMEFIKPVLNNAQKA